MNTPFSQHLGFINRGELDDELTYELAELVKMVRLTGKQGSITLTLKVSKANKRDEDTLKIAPSYKTTLPQLDQAETIMFSTIDGDLLRNDPNQNELELKEIPEPDSNELKEVATHG